jgi:hypothetical protein
MWSTVRGNTDKSQYSNGCMYGLFKDIIISSLDDRMISEKQIGDRDEGSGGGQISIEA